MSTVDGNKYCVRAPKLTQQRFLQTTVNMKQLVKHLEQKYPEQENVKQLVSNFNQKRLLKHYQQVNIPHIVKTRVKKLHFV